MECNHTLDKDGTLIVDKKRRDMVYPRTIHTVCRCCGLEINFRKMPDGTLIEN